MISLVIAVLLGRVWRWEGGLLAGYVFLILAITLLARQPFEGKHLQTVFLWSWREWKSQKNQILTNIVMFIPIGALAGWMWKWRGILMAVALSCIIEMLQYLTARGLCEYDDVFHNYLGAEIGAGIAILVKLINWKRRGVTHGA